LLGRKAFPQPNSAYNDVSEGVSLVSVTPLTISRLKKKKKIGYPYPAHPRIATASMMISLRVAPGESRRKAIVFDDDPNQVKVEYQDDTPPRKTPIRATKENPAGEMRRSFMNVTPEAAKYINTFVQTTWAEKLVAALDGLELDPVRITATL